MRAKTYLFIIAWMAALTGGCTGVTFPPLIFKGPPYTWLRGGEPIGRDQILNRLLVANHKVKVQGLVSNEVLTVLGQPQEIQVVERNVAEEWIYVYYKHYTPRKHSEPATFMVRFYHDKVIDVIRDV